MTGNRDAFLESWGQLSDPDPAPARDQSVQDLLSQVAAGDEALAQALVQLITEHEDVLAALASALAEEDPPEKLYVFATLPEFLEEYLLATFHKELDTPSLHWCEEWWRHPEARAAFAFLWDSWESHRRVASSMSDWLVHRAWPILDRLTGPLSPFDGCTYTTVDFHGQVIKEGQHSPRQRRLPVKAAPAELFVPRPTKANPNP